MWVPQWPLTSEKLKAVEELVSEQLAMRHIEPSTSPWNTPIFLIKKKTGKWRLLHDLRTINEQMHLFGPIQRGLPALSALPKDWHMIIIDIKDCFFSIPLHPSDRPRFALRFPPLIMWNQIRGINGKYYPKAWPIVLLCVSCMCRKPLDHFEKHFHRYL